MRLGDASNISHGRTSASTLDETLSGRADIASSAGSESDEEGDEIDQAPLPLHQHQHQPDGRPAQSIVTSGAKRGYKQFKEGLPSTDSAEPSGDEVDGDYYYDHKRDGVFKSDPDDLVNEFGQPATSRSLPKAVLLACKKYEAAARLRRYRSPANRDRTHLRN